MTAQASGTIGGGQGFLRNLGRMFGPSQQEISASRTQEAFRRNQELLERQANAARGAVIPNAQAEAAAMQILQPVQLNQARSVQDLSIRGAETEAEIQRKNEAQRAGLVQDTMRTGGGVATGLMETSGQVKERLNRPIFDHVQQLAEMGIGADAAARESVWGSQPLVSQVLGHVAEQSAANRASQERNTAPWQARLGADALRFAGLFLI
jgi:hypothetical protein